MGRGPEGALYRFHWRQAYRRGRRLPASVTAPLLVTIEKVERVPPFRYRQSVHLLQVLEIDIDRPGPVFRRLGRFRAQFKPAIDLHLFDGAIEVLKFYRGIFLVDGNHLKQVAI